MCTLPHMPKPSDLLPTDTVQQDQHEGLQQPNGEVLRAQAPNPAQGVGSRVRHVLE